MPQPPAVVPVVRPLQLSGNDPRSSPDNLVDKERGWHSLKLKWARGYLMINYGLMMITFYTL